MSPRPPSGSYADALLEHVGLKPRKRSQRLRADARPEQVTPLQPKAPPPPRLTVPRCQHGPECSHTLERFECHCDPPPPPIDDPIRTCAHGGQPQRERSDGSLDVLRCQTCRLCEWEKAANRWHEWSPWYRESLPERPAERPLFYSAEAAIVAWAEWERHDRWGPSAMGPLIHRLEQASAGAEPGTTYRRDREDPLLRRAGDLVPVGQAIQSAYPRGNPWRLSPITCQALLCARAGGVLERLPSWDTLVEQLNVGRDLEDDLGESLAVTKATIRSLVRHGQRYVTIELAARGVIPMPPRSFGWHEAIHERRGELEDRGT